MTCELCGNSASGYLCNRHREQLADGLQELPALYDEVGACLVPRRASWGDIIPTKDAAGPRSPINEDVIDTVTWGRAAEVLRLWREDVRRVRWPHRGATPPGDLTADCRWLKQELDWIVGNYPAAGDLTSEVWALEQQARSVVGDPLPRRQRLGLCVAVTGAEGAVCGAVLTRLPNEPVVCRWCGKEYRTPAELLLLHHSQPKSVA